MPMCLLERSHLFVANYTNKVILSQANFALNEALRISAEDWRHFCMHDQCIPGNNDEISKIKTVTHNNASVLND